MAGFSAPDGAVGKGLDSRFITREILKGKGVEELTTPEERPIDWAQARFITDGFPMRDERPKLVLNMEGVHH